MKQEYEENVESTTSARGLPATPARLQKKQLLTALSLCRRARVVEHADGGDFPPVVSSTHTLALAPRLQTLNVWDIACVDACGL